MINYFLITAGIYRVKTITVDSNFVADVISSSAMLYKTESSSTGD